MPALRVHILQVNESSSVQSRLRQRISDGFARGKEQMGQLVDKMQGSLRDVVASIARQDSRLHGSVSQLGARVDSIANATRLVERFDIEPFSDFSAK